MTNCMIFAIMRQIFTSRRSFALACLFYIPGLDMDLFGGVVAEMLKLNRNLWQILTWLSANVKQSSCFLGGAWSLKSQNDTPFCLRTVFLLPLASVFK